MSEVGHNSEAFAIDQLRNFVERAERLIEERLGINDDIRDVMLEAKMNGFDSRALREVIKLRALDKHVRDERAAILETYCGALNLA